MITVEELEKQLDVLAFERLQLELQLKDVEGKMAFIRIQLKAKDEEGRKAYSDALYAESKRANPRPSDRQVEVLRKMSQEGKLVRHRHHHSGTLFFTPPHKLARTTDVVAKETIAALVKLGLIELSKDNVDPIYYDIFYINDKGRDYLKSLEG